MVIKKQAKTCNLICRRALITMDHCHRCKQEPCSLTLTLLCQADKLSVWADKRPSLSLKGEEERKKAARETVPPLFTFHWAIADECVKHVSSRRPFKASTAKLSAAPHLSHALILQNRTLLFLFCALVSLSLSWQRDHRCCEDADATPEHSCVDSLDAMREMGNVRN